MTGYVSTRKGSLIAIRRCTLAAVAICLLVVVGCRGIQPPRSAVRATRDMTVTGYCRCGQCCNWRRTWYGRPVIASGPRKGQRKAVGITASGTKARVGTIAADTSRYPFGTVMYIEGYGYGCVEDRGGAIKGDHIDLYFRSHDEASRWGKKRMPVAVWTSSAR